MRKSPTWGVLAVAVALTAAACDDNVVDLPQNELTAEEATELAGNVADLTLLAVAAEIGDGGATQNVLAPQAEGTTTVTKEFSVTRNCPRGGMVQVAGTKTVVKDQATQNMVVEMGATKTHDDCAFESRGVVVTLNGDPNIAMSARFEQTAGQPDGPQTMSFEGAFNWSTDTGREGHCTVAINVVIDPEAKTRTVAGTFCGSTIESTITWQ